MYLLQQLQVFKESHLSLKEAQQFYSVYHIFLKRRATIRKMLGTQNPFDHSYLEMITFEDNIEKTENLLVQTLNEKLEILEIMKKKEVHAKELVIKIGNMLKNKKQIKKYLTSLYQINDKNAHLLNLIYLYLECLAFSSSEINLKRINREQQNEQLKKKNRNVSSDTQSISINLNRFDNQNCVVFAQYIDPMNLVIKNVSSNFKDIFNLNNNQEIIGNNIQKLIPKVFQQNHCEYIESFHKIAYRDIKNISYIQIEKINQINPDDQACALFNKLKNPQMQQIYELFFTDASELKKIIQNLEIVVTNQKTYLNKQFSSLKATNVSSQIYQPKIVTAQQISEKSLKNDTSLYEKNENILLNDRNNKLYSEQNQNECQSTKDKNENINNQLLESIFQDKTNQNLTENSCNKIQQNEFILSNQSPSIANNLYPQSRLEMKQNQAQITAQTQMPLKNTFINNATQFNNSISSYSQIKNQSIQSFIETNEENVFNKNVNQDQKPKFQTQNYQPQSFSSALKLFQNSIINYSKNQISIQDQELNYYSFPTSRQDFTIKNYDIPTQIYEKESERFNESLTFPQKNVSILEEHKKYNQKLQHDQESTNSQQSAYLSSKKQILKQMSDQSTLKSIKVIYFIGILCSVTIILMTWIQYIILKQKIQDSHLDYQVFVWPITYISKLSQLLKYQNTIYLVQYCQDLQFSSNLQKQQFQQESQNNLNQVYKSLIQMAGYMDRANSDRKVFQLLQQNQINMKIAQYYNTSLLSNTSSIPSLPMYTQYLTTLQHGMILQFQSIFRIVNNQGNGRSIYYLIANQLQEINLLQNVQNQMLKYQQNQQQQIEDELSIQMIVIIHLKAKRQYFKAYFYFFSLEN
ncbi:transmembrane protein, putative (macronuclear) [Tetrahymena thermophila SB210]|uniref:Transmembrane protein, putative n=1 Tax=Tetrahymena thermophila (strain SB210) TaxID=312017 RepID=Q23QK5_TETTS|nr:transmembrane protein, putative [Tetrahymena thermophila SB210]EAR98883.3 transmembrane protein, putative [Tetrahymena thermophila SB210]|eukprot:XP_001019128.3 transmembrane protein, putative [Tetrahymena thermophila SB210]